MVSVRPDVVSSTPDDGWVSAVRAMFPTIRCYPKPAVLMPDPLLAARRPDWADLTAAAGADAIGAEAAVSLADPPLDSALRLQPAANDMDATSAVTHDRTRTLSPPIHEPDTSGRRKQCGRRSCHATTSALSGPDDL